MKYLFSVISLPFRDLEDSSMDEGSIENQERGSLASFGSGNTTDSEKVHSFNVIIIYLVLF